MVRTLAPSTSSARQAGEHRPAVDRTVQAPHSPLPHASRQPDEAERVAQDVDQAVVAGGLDGGRLALTTKDRSAS